MIFPPRSVREVVGYRDPAPHKPEKMMAMSDALVFAATPADTAAIIEMGNEHHQVPLMSLSAYLRTRTPEKLTDLEDPGLPHTRLHLTMAMIFAQDSEDAAAFKAMADQNSEVSMDDVNAYLREKRAR